MTPRLVRFSLISIACCLCFQFSSLETYADKSFREHRFDSFTTLNPAKEGDIIFIGNSITNMMNWEDAFGSDAIKNRGTSGALTNEILENLPSMIAGNPSKIFLMIGTNDLGAEGKDNFPETVARRIREIIRQIRVLQPKAIIYYQSILPSTNGLRTQEKTEKTNEIIKNWIDCQKDDSLVYIDLYTPLLGADGGLDGTYTELEEESISCDGLHLTQRGYQKWMDIIRPYIGYTSTFPKTGKNSWGGLTGSSGMRNTQFPYYPVNTGDILLIGDEMIHSGEWHELMQSADFKDRGIGWGMGGMRILDAMKTFDSILRGGGARSVIKNTPKAIIFYCGINDLLNGTPVDSVYKFYKSAVNKLKAESSGAPIFLMTLLPFPDTESDINARIDELNSLIKRHLVSKKRKIFMIDVNNDLRKEGKRDEQAFMSSESPYLSGIGYLMVANSIADKVNPILQTDFKPITLEMGLNNLKNFNSVIQGIKNSGSEIIFDNAASEIPYRIPAIAVNNNGDIIAVADYRYSGQDIGVTKDGRIDLRYRIRDLATGQWSDVLTLAAAHGEGADFIAFGDPCIVSDRESSKVLVTSCSGNVSFFDGNHDNHQGWATFLSADGGKTWGDPKFVTDQVFEQLDLRSDGPIRCFFIGSGKILQSQSVKTGDTYRLYCAALVKTSNGVFVNYVFYSDDFGTTWKLLGSPDESPIPAKGDEPKVEELPDGNILISSRTEGGRLFNIYHFTDKESGEGEWDECVMSDTSNGGVVASSNACNGEVLIVKAIDTSTGEKVDILLQSVPLGPDVRQNVGVNYKVLKSPADYSSSNAIATSWNGTYKVSDTLSAYSTMVLDGNHDIAFLYEENPCNNGYDIVFKTIPLDIITRGRYKADRQGEETFQNTVELTPGDTDNDILRKASLVVPTPRQVNGLDNEFIAFVHFGPNTFTGKEWGTGKEDPTIFNPSSVDTDQWVETMSEAGIKMVILTVKHHDGYVLWQSRYTDHGIMQSPYLNGTADILQMLSESCRKYGMKMGVYLSPADLYQCREPNGLYGNLSKKRKCTIPTLVDGRPYENLTTFTFEVDDYNKYFLNQLFELLTEYGPIYEVWFDGANPMEKGGQTYDYRAWTEVIRTLAPEAVIFGTTDVRWCGNESGSTRSTEWNVAPYICHPDSLHGFEHALAEDIGSLQMLKSGQFLHYIYPEVDTSIREGWFYRDDITQGVRTADEVFDIYERSVGGNAVFLLNVPPGKDGRLGKRDVATLLETGRRIKETYGQNRLETTNLPLELTDNNDSTFICIDKPLVIATLDTLTINRIVLREPISLKGERIESLNVEAYDNGQWLPVTECTNIGHKRILRFPDIQCDSLRITVVASRNAPYLSEVSAHYYKSHPPVLSIFRDKTNKIIIQPEKNKFNWKTSEKENENTVLENYIIRYTVDGVDPDDKSPIYAGPIELPSSCEIKAFASTVSENGPIKSKLLGISKENWDFIGGKDEHENNKPVMAFDNDPSTYWRSTSGQQSFILDLGTTSNLNGMIYLPQTQEYGEGMIAEAKIETSIDGENWNNLGIVTFSNLTNDPSPRRLDFAEPTKARFFHLVPQRLEGNSTFAAIAELDLF